MNDGETNKILKEILKWERLIGTEILRKKVKEEKDLFADPKAIVIYNHSDGDKSTRELAKMGGVTHTTVQALWKKWIDAGIAESTEKYGGGRCRRIFELNELGLELPVPDKGKGKE